MTEKEKCAQGLMYNPNYDTELIRERSTCKSLCQDYNETRYTDETRRKELIHKILKPKGSFLIEQPFWCDYGYNIEIGNNFYSNHNLVILDGAKVTIGDNAFIGPNCGLYTAGHAVNAAERNAGLEYAKPINIGHNVWIGGNVSIMPGVSIGDNTIIGGGSVVTKDIPAQVIAAGNPCRVIKNIED